MKISEIGNPNFYTLAERLKTAEQAAELLGKDAGCPAVIVNDRRLVVDAPEVSAALRRAIDDYVRRLRGEIRRQVLTNF